MTEDAAQHLPRMALAAPAALVAAVATFVLTVVIPPLGLLVGAAALVAVGLGRTRPTLVTAAVAGAAAAVVCYLGIWLIGSLVDPGAPGSGSGSSAASAS